MVKSCSKLCNVIFWDPSIPDSFPPYKFVGVLPFESGAEEVNLKTEEECSGGDDSRTDVVRYIRGSRGIRNGNYFNHNFPVKINLRLNGPTLSEGYIYTEYLQGCLGHE